MTTDAKVGLLLGLVFIVIIAFVINGLPDFVHNIKDKPALRETAVTVQTGNNLVIEPEVVEVARSLQQGRTNPGNAEPVSQGYSADGSGGTQSAFHSAAQGSGQGVIPSQESSVSDARSQMLTQSQLPIQQKPQTDSAFSATIHETASGADQALVIGQQPDLTSQSNKQAAQTRQVAEQTVEQIKKDDQAKLALAQAAAEKSQKEAQVKTPDVSAKTHVVANGESLGSIAKKYYGPEIGNQRATVQYLYEANKKVVSSPEKLKVGDKLVIPVIAAGKPSASATLMEKFKGVFESTDKKSDAIIKNNVLTNDAVQDVSAKSGSLVEKAVDTKKPAAAPVADSDSKSEKKSSSQKSLVKVPADKAVRDASAKSFELYTVQKGDYPFKIAQKCLGDGNRYPEILKLNSELGKATQLKVGAKLKVPKK